MNVSDIKAQIKGIIGKEIFFYETVGSTNTVAAELFEKTSEGAVVLADSQERGRGRLGRTWISPAGVNHPHERYPQTEDGDQGCNPYHHNGCSCMRNSTEKGDGA